MGSAAVAIASVGVSTWVSGVVIAGFVSVGAEDSVTEGVGTASAAEDGTGAFAAGFAHECSTRAQIATTSRVTRDDGSLDIVV
jgi:hypothetical protein